MKEWNKKDRVAVIEEGKNNHVVEIKRKERERDMNVIMWPRLNHR